MDRDEMLRREEEAWTGFLEAIRATAPDRRTDEGVVPGWSTHDLVWHCAYWTAWAGDVVERLIRGEPEPEQPEDEEAWTRRSSRRVGRSDGTRRSVAPK